MAEDTGNKVPATSGGRRGSDRINPDSMTTLWFTVGLVCFLAVASFMVSFTGLHEVAAWAGLPVWLRWAVPVFIDVAILAYTMAVLIHRHRGERTWASWVSLAGFTLFSMVANGAHALSIGHPDDVQRIIGAAVAALAPLAVFAATEQLGRLVIRRPALQPTPDTYPVPVHNGNSTQLSILTDEGPQTPSHQITTAPLGEGKTPDHGAATPESLLPAVTADTDPGPGADADVFVPAASEGPGTTGAARPLLSVVGRKPRPADLQAWVKAVVASGTQPTGKDAAEFLGVSERTGRARLTDLKKAEPDLFNEIALKQGTNP